MRRAAVALVLALLLPCPIAPGDRVGTPAPLTLSLFGGEGGPGPAAHILIVEAYYHALRADEYVVLANPSAGSLNLSGWSLTDGEGTLTFPDNATLPPNGRAVIAQNATAYMEDTLRAADFQYGGGNARAMVRSGRFQLNNDGDEVLLRDPSSLVVDAFVYGDSAYAGEGWTGPPARRVGSGLLARRDAADGWRDTNSSADWDLVRVWSLGQSEFRAATFAFEGDAFAFASPDGGATPLLDLLGAAVATIDASLYTLTSRPVADGLLDALGRGVRVRVLLEGGPVGGVDKREWGIVNELAMAGADVRFLVDNTTLDIQERYRFLHAKYAILDGETVLVSSENWGSSGFPPPGIRGSRGWSVAVTHAPLAAYFAAVFEEDFDGRRRDVFPLAAMAVSPSRPRPDEPGFPPTPFAPRRFHGVLRVVPVLGPDMTLGSETILGALGNATTSIHAEIFYADPTWGDFPNLYLEALLAAARRGVAVRLLLDASYFNVEDDDAADNDDTVAYVNGVAEVESLDLKAKLASLSVHGYRMLHNKGLIVDGRTVFVSSVNWNRNSPTANREAGLLIENRDLAAYFEEVFAWDWKEDVTPPIAEVGPDRIVALGRPIRFTGLGSWDEASITNFSWDFDADGVVDAWGPEVEYTYLRAGTFEAQLQVADAWNNTATDVANVTVVRPLADKSVIVRPVPWELVAGIPAAALWFALARRRRKGISKSP